MKIQIDTTFRTIKIEEPVNIAEFFTMVKKLFPNDMWKEFKLETNVIQNWNSPIIINEYPSIPIIPIPCTPNIPWNPIQPYPWIICDTNTNDQCNYTLQNGTFNIDCKVKN